MDRDRLLLTQITVALMGVKDYNAALVSDLEISIEVLYLRFDRLGCLGGHSR